MHHTALRSDTGALAGLNTPVNYGSGTEWSKGLINKYSNTSIQLGLWLVGACTDVAEGKLSKEIKRLATFFLSIHPTPVYLRIGYEFDSPENDYKPLSYIAAFRTIVDDLRMYNVKNLHYVWHSYSQLPAGGYSQQDWYPGEASVYVCLSVCLCVYVGGWVCVCVCLWVCGCVGVSV